LRNRRGVVAWLTPFRYNLERWAYTLQRLTGVVVALYFVVHIVETGNVVGGPMIWLSADRQRAAEAWTTTVNFLSNPFFDAGLVVIGWMVVYHTINGIRLTLAELGYGVGRPAWPHFPYEPRSFTPLERGIFWGSIVFACLSTVYALHVFFGP